MGRYRSHRHYQHRSPRSAGRSIVRGIRTTKRAVRTGYTIAKLPFQVGKALFRTFRRA
jgi:hypothetical protein